MSASWPGIMRGPRLKTLLLLLLLLLTTLTESVVCQDEEEENTDPEVEIEEEQDAETGGDGDTTTPVIDASPAPDSIGSEDTDPDLGTEEGENHGSGEESKINYDNYETSPTSTMLPDGVTPEPEEGQELSLIIILLPVVLVILLIGMIVCGIFVNRRWKQKAGIPELVKDDPYLDGSSTEKVPMPMFEEDVPSVLELEMEELDQWMKKDSVTADDSHHA